VIKSRIIRCMGHVAGTVERKDTYRVFVGNPEEKRPLGQGCGVVVGKNVPTPT
jgi:hypothetical protein